MQDTRPLLLATDFPPIARGQLEILQLPLAATGKPRTHIVDLADSLALPGSPIAIGEHCYGCTAGQGSSCGGAL